MNFEISTLKQKVQDVKGTVEHHLVKETIFQYDAFIPPIVHFVKNDISSVHQMGKILELSNTKEPLVLFDR